jgi:hypothetical protein
MSCIMYIFLNLLEQSLEQNIDHLTFYCTEAEYRGPARHMFLYIFLNLSVQSLEQNKDNLTLYCTETEYRCLSGHMS